MIDLKIDYELIPYLTPVPVRGKLFSQNRFLKVTVLEKEYFLSTLPGFHETSLEEVAFKLKNFFSDYPLDFNDIQFDKKFFNLITLDRFTNTFSGEMLFHTESILLGIIRTTHPHLFSKVPVLLNELYRSQNGPDFYKDSSCLKIKIVPTKANETASVINSLNKLNPELIYRLDGNRKFELDELLSFVEVLEKNIPMNAFKNIDYIEEPFKNFYDTYSFEKSSNLKIAIDESFKFFMDHKNNDSRISVIKPSLIGISPVWNWLRSNHHQRAIISSSFEHPTILLCLQILAQLRPEEYHGLENFFVISK
jgi:hypothetical protein